MDRVEASLRRIINMPQRWGTVGHENSELGVDTEKEREQKELRATQRRSLAFTLWWMCLWLASTMLRKEREGERERQPC